MRGRKANYSIVDPQIKSLYNKGWSLSKIGKHLKIHPQIVKRRCGAMGIQVRNISQAMYTHHKNRRNDAKEEKDQS